MKPLRVLVTGASGQLGSVIVKAFADREVIAPDRASLDVTRPEAVRRVVAVAAPDLIVNCTAFNDVDGAESRPLEALEANAFAVRSLALAAAESGAMLVHYSTDFVFDGSATTPYSEEAAPAPRNTYGASKLLGEWFALEAPRAIVLRVESLFGSPRGWTGRRGTIDGIVDGLEQGKELRVFTDRVISPSYTADIAAATRHLTDTAAASGVYHCVNAGHATWHELAIEAARMLGVVGRLVPVTMDQVVMKATRPRYCALSPAKLATASFLMPPWQEALRRWFEVRGVAGQ